MDTTSGVALASIQFQVAAYGGQTIASQLVNVTDVTSTAGYYYDGHGTFYWTWDCSAAATNTVYDFAATATSTDGYAGNTMHLYPKLDHTVLPAPPKAVVATAGDGAVSLSWSMSPSTEIAYYEVFRRESTTATWKAL